MQYQVPQFIDVEDKIFGPFTFKQAIYMVGGLGLSYLLYRFLPSLILSGIPIVVVMSASAALAFYKVNDRPFINVMESAFKYAWNAKLYLWKKVDRKPKAPKAAPANPAPSYAGVMVPKVSASKLKDLAWSLDVQEKVGSGQTIQQ